MNLNRYLKTVVAVVGALAVALQTQFPAAHWSTTVTAAVSAILVYITPNTPPPPPGIK